MMETTRIEISLGIHGENPINFAGLVRMKTRGPAELESVESDCHSRREDQRQGAVVYRLRTANIQAHVSSREGTRPEKPTRKN